MSGKEFLHMCTLSSGRSSWHAVSLLALMSGKTTSPFPFSFSSHSPFCIPLVSICFAVSSQSLFQRRESLINLNGGGGKMEQEINIQNMLHLERHEPNSMVLLKD